ncbi:bifunctional protein-serine/threonine kinase/phosphatase [Oxalicibacterium solurbis]|nr:bifunctional protein-serine/threonine kinase/phosphatase [Oxalicibacterium solurbis]
MTDVAPDVLRIATGQYSDKGRKPANQDFHGIVVPMEPQLSAKGVAVALSDGISSSDVSQHASQSAVTGFLEDYYCTSETWSVKTSAERVLTAVNSWLHAQNQRSPYRYDRDRGYVCTFSALVLKSNTAHLFHVGDTRIYRLHGNALEQLTQDHRVRIHEEQSYLGRALGVNPQVEIDYLGVPLELGDCFVLATDGVYEYVDAAFVTESIEKNGDDLDRAATLIAQQAYRNGSDDNLTLQIVRIDALPARNAGELYRQLTELPLPPLLDARATLDGYRIVRPLHASARSHLYLATDEASGDTVVLKTPSIDMHGDASHLERFLMEEWVARRIDSPHVLKPYRQTRRRNYLYVVTEFVEGQTLAQWMIDHPKPDLETVRGIVEQIAAGLRAFHRLEMLHQDLRPDNIMIDATGTVKIIDFGAASVAGLDEASPTPASREMLGTLQYTAPEYFLGEGGSPRADLFSLGVIAYQLLTGRLPYGAQAARAWTRSAQQKLRYTPVLDDDLAIPLWIDDVLRKAVHPDPGKRYAELSEFVFDLRHPNRAFLNRTRAPLIERNPLAFWKSLSLLLSVTIVVLVYLLTMHGHG